MPVGPWELVLLLLIVVTIFGAGRLADVGGALGKGIREFRASTREEADHGRPLDTRPQTRHGDSGAAISCARCGTAFVPGQVYCGQCGAPVAPAA